VAAPAGAVRPGAARAVLGARRVLLRVLRQALRQALRRALNRQLLRPLLLPLPLLLRAAGERLLAPVQ
jgi:hypothetical protein